MGQDTQKSETIVRRDAEKVLEILFEISEAVSSTRNLDELYRVIHRSLARSFNAENFYIALHNEAKDSITFPYYVDEKDEEPEEILNLSKTASLTAQVIQKRTPAIFYTRDIVELARSQNKKAIGTLCKVWIGAPLIIRDRVIGVIAMQSFQSESDYRKEDLDLLSAISRHIALAIERRESAQELSKQQNILERILESSPVGICLMENRVFKWVNTEMLRLFGYRDKFDFEQKDARMIYPSEAAYRRAGEIILKGLKEKGKSDFDFTLKKKDGTLFKAHIIITGNRGEDPLEQRIVTMADISEREIAQKEKLEREKLQGVLEMAGAVCHEINQPLQAILGYATLFQEEIDVSVRNLEKIKVQAKRIGRITRRLSGITRYRTIDYPGDTKIVDIWGSSNDNA